MTQCRQFIVALEDYLARHPNSVAEAPPARLAEHADHCAKCQERWRVATRSRSLLASLRHPAEPGSEAFDAHFLTRLNARVREQERQIAARGFFGLRVAGRDLTLAALLFACTLGSFVYNLQRTERPNADEAMVLDVPHLNPMHPADDHVHPQLADAMLSLMNP